MKIYRTLIILLILSVFCIIPALAEEIIGEESGGVLVIPDSVTVIEEEAFCGDTSFEEVVLPEGLRQIKSRAFAGSGVKRIGLPDTLTYIADDAFEDTVIPEMYLVSYTAEDFRDTYAYKWGYDRYYFREKTGFDPQPENIKGPAGIVKKASCKPITYNPATGETLTCYTTWWILPTVSHGYFTVVPESNTPENSEYWVDEENNLCIRINAATIGAEFYCDAQYNIQGDLGWKHAQSNICKVSQLNKIELQGDMEDPYAYNGGTVTIDAHAYGPVDNDFNMIWWLWSDDDGAHWHFFEDDDGKELYKGEKTITFMADSRMDGWLIQANTLYQEDTVRLAVLDNIEITKQIGTDGVYYAEVADNVTLSVEIAHPTDDTIYTWYKRTETEEWTQKQRGSSNKLKLGYVGRSNSGEGYYVTITAGNAMTDSEQTGLVVLPKFNTVQNTVEDDTIIFEVTGSDSVAFDLWVKDAWDDGYYKIYENMSGEMTEEGNILFTEDTSIIPRRGRHADYYLIARDIDNNREISTGTRRIQNPDYRVVRSSIAEYTGLAIGCTRELAPFIACDNGYSYTWASSNPDVVAVDENGRITALAQGTAYVSAIANNDDTADILVEVRYDIGIVEQGSENRVLPEAYAGIIGDEQVISAVPVCRDANGTYDAQLTWQYRMPEEETWQAAGEGTPFGVDEQGALHFTYAEELNGAEIRAEVECALTDSQGEGFSYCSAVSSITVLYAYDVTFDPNGGVFADGTTEAKTERMISGIHTVDLQVTQEGHTFGGWSLNGEVVTEFDLTGDITLTAVLNPILAVISSQPEDLNYEEEGYYLFEVESDGADDTYTWQYSTDNGKTWANRGSYWDWNSVDGTGSYSGVECHVSAFMLKVTERMDGYQLRCAVTNHYGNTAYTDPAALTLVQIPWKRAVTNVTAGQNGTDKELHIQWTASQQGQSGYIITLYDGTYGLSSYQVLATAVIDDSEERSYDIDVSGCLRATGSTYGVKSRTFNIGVTTYQDAPENHGVYRASYNVGKSGTVKWYYCPRPQIMLSQVSGSGYPDCNWRIDFLLIKSMSGMEIEYSADGENFGLLYDFTTSMSEDGVWYEGYYSTPERIGYYRTRYYAKSGSKYYYSEYSPVGYLHN